MEQEQAGSYMMFPSGTSMLSAVSECSSL
jgi:hypothetical protein